MKSTVNIADTAKKPSTTPHVRETGESNDVFGCSFSDEGFAGEFPPLYTDFDLLANFPEPPLDFLSNLPEEPFTLAPFSTSTSPDLHPDATSQAAAQVDDFFQDITDLFQLSVGRTWRYGWLLRSASSSRHGEDTALWRASRSARTAVRRWVFGDGSDWYRFSTRLVMHAQLQVDCRKFRMICWDFPVWKGIDEGKTINGG
ncbi:hypothetical protein GUJ93_ZPchr0003g16648 [Zizania palustris]|uniref:Uncharacterized protein n=1 Tax=Zizania palustris TaxID=103762 RepID=A0A8J5SF48_ZIZPA|nr:hypothetical protein GUJ93_ZPchr0003g16648 [Zizania palustris]